MELEKQHCLKTVFEFYTGWNIGLYIQIYREIEDARRFRVTIIIFTSPIWESYFTFVLSSHVVVHSF